MTTHVRRCGQIWNPNHRITCTRVDHEIKFVTVNTQFELRHFLKSITIVLNLRTRKCLLWGVCVYDSLPFLCSSVGRWIVSPPSASSSLSVGRGVLSLARKEGRRWGEDCHTLKWRIQRSIWFLFNFLSFLPVNPSHLFQCCCFFWVFFFTFYCLLCFLILPLFRGVSLLKVKFFQKWMTRYEEKQSLWTILEENVTLSHPYVATIKSTIGPSGLWSPWLPLLPILIY